MKTILIALSSLLLTSELSAQTVVTPGNYSFQRRQFPPQTGFDVKQFTPVSLDLVSFDASLNPTTTPISTYGRTLIQTVSASSLINSLLPTPIAGEFLSTDGTNWIIAEALKPGQVSGSLVMSGGFLTLSGDTGSPGNSYYYGTNGSGTKGWYTLPSQVNADWNSVSGPSQILNKPSIPAAQVNADWNSVSGVSQILNKPALGTAALQNSSAFDPAGSAASAQAFAIQRANQTGTQLASTISDFSTAALSAVTWSTLTGKPTFATVATTGAFSDLSGTGNIVQTTGSYSNPSWITGLAWSKVSSTPTTLAGYGITDAYPLSGNPSGFLTGITSGQVTTALGFTPYNATNPSGFVSQSGARTAISLTTTGTSGAATYNSSTGVLNVPNYAVTSGTVTSVGLSSTDLSVSGSPVTTSGSITANLTTTGVSAGTYSSVTVDTKGRVTAGTAMSVNNAPGRSLVTVAAAANGWQVSATRNAEVRYSVTIVSTASLSGAQSGYVVLEICPNNSATAGDWIEIGRVSNGQSVALAIALTAIATGGGQINGTVPAGYYVRQRSVNVSGAPTFTVNSQQEVLY